MALESDTASLAATPGKEHAKLRVEYEVKLKEFQAWRSAIMAGACDPAHPDWPKYLELKQWIRDNFRADIHLELW